jgi:predicted RNA binding protein YcfA (HicA-like mRNA interferase family)
VYTICDAQYTERLGTTKTLRQLLSGRADATIRFDDLCALLEGLGFEKRVKGSHHLFRKVGVEERINLQREGNHAKPYQVKQVRAVLLRYKLGDAE